MIKVGEGPALLAGRKVQKLQIRKTKPQSCLRKVMASKDCVTALDKIGNNFQTHPEGKATEIAEPQINGGRSQ